MDVSALFTQSTHRPITYQEAHNELLEAYDNVMGFETGPAHVGMSREENPLWQSLLEIWSETYAREKIWDIYHVDFDTFLDRPRYEIQMMLRNSERLRKLQGQVAANVKSELELLEQNNQHQRGHRTRG